MDSTIYNLLPFFFAALILFITVGFWLYRREANVEALEQALRCELRTRHQPAPLQPPKSKEEPSKK